MRFQANLTVSLAVLTIVPSLLKARSGRIQHKCSRAYIKKHGRTVQYISFELNLRDTTFDPISSKLKPLSRSLDVWWRTRERRPFRCWCLDEPKQGIPGRTRACCWVSIKQWHDEQKLRRTTKRARSFSKQKIVHIEIEMPSRTVIFYCELLWCDIKNPNLRFRSYVTWENFST